MDFIKMYDRALDPSVCQEIIKRFEDDPRKQPGELAEGYNPNIKMCVELHTSHSEWLDLDKKIYQAVNTSFKQYWKDCPSILNIINHNEITDTGYQIQKYSPSSEDRFDWHIDSDSIETVNRILAGIIYLNDVKKGGETEFKILDQSLLVKPKEGSILWFPPTFQYLHRGKKPISEPKYIITTFIAYRSTKDK